MIDNKYQETAKFHWHNHSIIRSGVTRCLCAGKLQHRLCVSENLRQFPQQLLVENKHNSRFALDTRALITQQQTVFYLFQSE